MLCNSKTGDFIKKKNPPKNTVESLFTHLLHVFFFSVEHKVEIQKPGWLVLFLDGDWSVQTFKYI